MAEAEATTDLVFDLVDKLKDLVTDRKPAAIAMLGGLEQPVTMTHFDYWESPEQRAAFEQQVGEKAREIDSSYGAFGVPLIVREDDESIDVSDLEAGAPAQSVPEGCQEQLWVFAWDVAFGFDMLRVRFTRRPDGEPVFGEVELYNGDFRMAESAPGFQAFRVLLGSEEING